MSNKNRILLIFHANVNKRRQQIEEKGRPNVPLADYLALIDTLDADYIDQETVDSKGWSRFLRRYIGYELVLALIAFLRRKRYELIYGDSEVIGLPLAFLFKLTRTRRRLLFIGHRLTPFSRTFFLDFLRVQKYIDTVFVHTLAQQTVAIARSGFTHRQVQLIPYQIDPVFWSMEAYEAELAREGKAKPASEKPYICSAGLEFRDYPTLLEAVKGLDVEVRLAVGSHYSNKDSGLSGELPPNVKVGFYNYTELRELYANSAFVVVPTKDVDHAAGVTSIMEAMSMGRAVIATRSVGQSDVLNDRRSNTRSNYQRVAHGTFLIMYGSSQINNLQTGFYVNPGEPDELRQSIKYLLENPDRAEEIGSNARRVIDATMTLDHFCDRIKDKMVEHLSMPIQGKSLAG